MVLVRGPARNQSPMVGNRQNFSYGNNPQRHPQLFCEISQATKDPSGGPKRAGEPEGVAVDEARSHRHIGRVGFEAKVLFWRGGI